MALLVLVAAAPGAPSSSASQRPVTALVRIPVPQEDGSLTPYTFELGYSLMTLVYDTLMWRDDQGVPQPWLARSVVVSPDRRSLMLQLQPGVSWQDGAPLNAADVAFTFRYVVTHPHPRFSGEVREVESVRATSDLTGVLITLRRPDAGFLDQTLADLPILPAHIWQRLPASAIAPEGLPVGSGPYRLVEHNPGRSYRFEANAGYFRGPPAVETIQVPIIDDAERTLAAFEQGEVDMVPITLRENDEARLTQLGNRILRGPAYLGTALMLNVRRPPFDDLGVRRAVSRALDLTRMAGVLGNSVAAARGYLHPASRWAPTVDLHEVDERGAAAVLGRGTRAPIEVLAPDNDEAKIEAGRQVALALARAGQQASVRPVPRSQLSRSVGEDGSIPSFAAAIWSTYPLASYDPDFLPRVFGSDPSSSVFDYSGYGSQAFDAAARRVSATADPMARRAAVADELRILAEDAPVIPLVFPVGTYAFRPARYSGWVFVKGSGILDKLSFVDPRPIEPSPPAAPLGPTGAGGPSLVPLWLALGLLGLALAGGMCELWRRRP